MARYALIIGIAEYTGHFPSLETPVQNANAIADLLDRYGDFNQVKRLPFRREAGQKDLGKVIRKPLSNEILVREIQQFLQDADGSDVLLYYSGHGFTKLDQLSQTPEGYLAPSDCQVELNAAGQVTAEKNGVSLFGLNTLINRHTFSSLVVILDCCNSGAFLESSMIRRDVTAFGYQRDYYLITACRSASKAYEGEAYSLLTTAILQGLAPANASPGSGRISGDRLFDVIGNELQNSRQEPIRMGWGRLITLVKYQQQPESAAAVAHPFNAENPYMGLKPFGQEQAAYFFGREQAVRALLDRLAENRFLAVIGPSGCGKSSLVKAGLLPQLEGDRIPGSRDWQVESITPGGQYPLQVLTNALERHHSNDKTVVLFVDQFEELFTLCPREDDQRTFIKRLNEETNDPTRQTRIIVAMRGDFLDRCAKFQEAADLINSTAPTTYMVIPLTEAKLVGDLEDSITCPAALHGVTFEQGLVSRIVDDVVNQPGAMPLLQYALLQLWDNCIAPDRPSRQLTLQSYEAIDGVKGALQRWADQFYTNLSPTDQAFVRELISELVQIGDGNEVTRRRATWERLRSIASQEQLDRIIGRLIYQRLLVADDNTVEVAHEALLSESKLIQGWIEENREGIRLQQRLEIYRHEWQEHDRSENYLLDAGRLAAIDEWIEKKQPRLMPIDQEFIGKSRERRDRQFQAQLEQERRLREAAEATTIAEIEKKIEAEARAEAETSRAKESSARAKAEKQKTRIATGAGILVAVLITSLGLLAVQSAKRQEQISKADEIKTLVSLSETYYSTHTQLEALLASTRALWRLRNFNGNDNENLGKINRVISGIHEKNRFEDHSAAIFGVSFSPKGSLIASAGDDRLVRIWKPDGTLIKTVSPMMHEKAIWTINFSSSGEFIASGDQSGIIKIWRKDGTLLDAFKGHINDVNFIAFSPDDRKIISASDDKTVKIWAFDLNSKKVLKKSPLILQHNSTVWMTTFSPDGHFIASAIDKRAINIWRSDGTLLTTLMGHTASVRYASFSSDGKALVSASDDNTIRIWQWQKDQKHWTSKILTGKSNKGYTVRFSPDDQTIAASSANGTIQLWHYKDLSEIIPFGRHLDQILDLAFSPDSKQIVTVSRDKTVRIWNLDSVNSESQISIDYLLAKSCSWLSSYLRTNSTAKRVYNDVVTNCNTLKVPSE